MRTWEYNSLVGERTGIIGAKAVQSGMDRFSLARLMGHSSPAVAARYYVHVTETHVAAGFGKFVEYQTRNVAWCPRFASFVWTLTWVLGSLPSVRGVTDDRHRSM
jgi:hypothetical protein